jgi:hypothetical protein
MHMQTTHNTAPLRSAPPVLATREIITLSLPVHWLGAILYGDATSFSPCEARAFTRWLRDVQEDVGHGKPIAVGTINTNEYFARYHDAAEYGVLPCMCVDVDLICEA